jgi:hypothetical protein
VKSSQARARAAIAGALQGDKISLLCIDSDGEPKRDIDLYRPFLAPGCILVIDDLGSDGQDEGKSERTVPQVAEMTSAGVIVPFGMFKWATFFGRLAA